jgi:hypothetical protein
MIFAFSGCPQHPLDDLPITEPGGLVDCRVRQATSVSDVRIYFYDDHGGVRTPVSYRVQYRASNGSWLDIPGQQRFPELPAGNDLNRIICPQVLTDALRIVITSQAGAGAGNTDLQSWRRP